MSEAPAISRRRRATFNLYVGIPDELGAEQLEVVTVKLIEFLNGGGLSVLNATWSCPEVGKRVYPPTPLRAADLDEMVEDSQEEGRQDQAKDFPPVPNAVTTTRSKRKRPREKNQPPRAQGN